MELELAAADHEGQRGHVLGPTWTTDPSTGKFIAPEYSLGWGVIEWMTRYLRQPDGPGAGGPLVLTSEQVRFIVWWYAVDHFGRFLYTSGVLRRLKGWGKDPLGAALCFAEMVGPVVFDSFDNNGRPVGRNNPAAWVHICATSQDQTKNTTSLWRGMMSPELIKDYGLDPLRTQVRTKHDARSIEAVTSNPTRLEGARTTFVLCNETQLWTEANQGHAMDNAIVGNLTKVRAGQARRLNICNAHVPGLDSIGERDYDAFMKMEQGQAKRIGLMYDSIEAPADTDLADVESLKAGLLVARGDADWLDVDRMVETIHDIRNPPTESRRKYLNQVIASEDAWMQPYIWDSNRDESLKLEPGDVISLGFDGSRTKDSTGLVACRASDHALFVLGLWENPGGVAGKNWSVPRQEVEQAVEQAFEDYKVRGFYADVNEWESYVEKWGATYRNKLRVGGQQNKVAWDMRGRMQQQVTALASFETALKLQQQPHDGDPRLRRHVLNAYRRDASKYGGITFGKKNKDSPRKVDLLAAAMLARMAMADLLTHGKAREGEPRKRRNVW